MLQTFHTQSIYDLFDENSNKSLAKKQEEGVKQKNNQEGEEE